MVQLSVQILFRELAVKPVVKVSYGRDALTLEEGKDYKLVGVGAYTEPTTTKKYTVSVEGINGYTGTTSSVNANFSLFSYSNT